MVMSVNVCQSSRLLGKFSAAAILYGRANNKYPQINSVAVPIHREGEREAADGRLKIEKNRGKCEGKVQALHYLEGYS